MGVNVGDVRREFPVTRDVVFLDIANHSPPSVSVREAIRSYLADWDRLQRRGDERVDEAIGSFSCLIGAAPDEVAFQPNTSTGLTAVAESLGLRKGTNVVVNDLENPANVYPWLSQRRRGADVRIVRGIHGAVPLEDVEAAVDDGTKALAISHVEWLTGARNDLRRLAEIAHDHGAHLVVDGIQAAGALDVDVKRDGVDFYACGSYKWLLGPSGAGFLYVRDELIDSIEPPFYGYRGVERHSLDEPKLKGSAKRFELGEPSYLSFVGTKAGIDTILRLGPKDIEDRVLALSKLLYDRLIDAGVEVVSPGAKELRSGIVSFAARGVEGLFKELVSERFMVSLRSAGIRVSTGFYNTEDEIERFAEHVKRNLHGHL
jgi:selenocysteine lyase/cysteine desulfurase